MSDALPLITVADDRIALGPMRRDLVPVYHAWINDPSVNRFLELAPLPMTLDQELSWFDNATRDATTALFTIYEVPSYRPIGNCNLHKIAQRNRSAELGILIGERAARGRGLGTAAVRLLCDWGFHSLGLNNIMLETYEWNLAGQKAYVRAGFREIGRRRQARYFDGRYWDTIYYDLLRDEFDSTVVHAMITEGIPAGRQPSLDET